AGVPAGVDAAPRLAVAVVHGARPGPVLALVAGAHGTEYASIVALERLIARLDPGDVSGTVVILPLLNVASFEQKVPHLNPVDGKNMNRMYPGRADGTQTERVSYLVTKQVVEPLRPPHRLPRRGHRREPATVHLLVEDRERGPGQ